MIIDMVFIGIILLFITMYGEDARCGIPIFSWCIIYFVILLLKSLGQGLKIIFIRYRRNWLSSYSLISFLVLDGFMLGWLVYGNIIFYSEADNCGVIPNAKALYYMMFFLLIIGYIQILFFLILLCLIPFIFYYIYSR